MALVIIWDPFERLLWGMAIMLAFISGLLYLNNGRKRKDFNEKTVLAGFACLFFGISMGRIFTYLSEFMISGIFINYTFYGDLAEVTSTYTFFYDFLYPISFVMGFLSMILSFEIIVRRTKYILTLIGSILLISMIFVYFFNVNTPHALYYILLEYCIVISLMMLFFYTKWSRLEFKAISSIIFIGTALILFSCDLASRPIKELNSMPLFIPPIIFILGFSIILSPLLLNPKLFSRALFYWLATGIAVIGLICIIEFYFIFIGVPALFSVLYFIWIIVLAFFLYKSTNYIKSEISPVSEIKIKERRPEVLGAFTRPQMITEEEVSISKEKKVCLVCKGKIGGFNLAFICTACDVIYCEKCARALVELENMCWACNAPINPSRPVKPFQKEEEKVVIEEDVPKKSRDNPI